MQPYSSAAQVRSQPSLHLIFDKEPTQHAFRQAHPARPGALRYWLSLALFWCFESLGEAHRRCLFERLSALKFQTIYFSALRKGVRIK
jgi:hypothetical protein